MGKLNKYCNHSEYSHQFKDDPEYGQILKRMCNGKFSQQACNVISERLIGHKLQLPDFDADADV